VGENVMKNIRLVGLSCGVVIFTVILGMKSISASSDAKPKPETIQATAQGTDVQLGTHFNVTLIIERYSTAADRQMLKQAFQQDKNQGLYKELSKMKAVGHISVNSALGYDVSYIRSVQTPSGRTIRFITTRPISMREQYNDSLSTAYNLTAGQIELNDSDRSKSTGVLYPRAMLKLDKDNEIQFDLATDPYKLADILDRRD
jgi:hypothetical protein